MANGRIFSAERKKAHQDVLFWARRLSYKQSDNHPEWRTNYENAKRKLAEIKENEK